ncbi:thiamine phosphate synthase, partial [Clostridioides difficile]|uniref:thiamine phosphate synthase n=1 Tax=Clostridioides difficile TaxID=1496 RepID=UPI003F8D17CF
HIYETKCKENLLPKGIELVKEAKQITDIKVVALGGILPSNVKETLKYCDDFAIMSTIMKSKNIEETISNYNEKIQLVK